MVLEQKLMAEMAQLDKELKAIPVDKRVCYNEKWYKMYIRRQTLPGLLDLVRREGWANFKET